MFVPYQIREDVSLLENRLDVRQLKESLDDTRQKIDIAAKRKDAAYDCLKKTRLKNKTNSKHAISINNPKARNKYFKMLEQKQHALTKFDYACKKLDQTTANYELAKKKFDITIIEFAEVPEQYISITSVITTKKSNCVELVIGDISDSRHGHYAISLDGEITYRREFGEPHGRQNCAMANLNDKPLNLSYA